MAPAPTRPCQAYVASNGKRYDHEAEIERRAFQRETLASLSGGTEKANYFGSLSLTDDPAS